MSGIKDQERIEEVRRRLYERGNKAVEPHSHTLSDIRENVRSTWGEPVRPAAPAQTQVRAMPPSRIETPLIQTSPAGESMPRKSKRNGYRFKLLVGGIVFFILAVGASSLYLMFGKTGISGNNITIAVTGPFTVGGGETLKMQVGVTNSNSVPIESATLIVEYPDGTQSVASGTAKSQMLFTERLPLKTIEAGETVNVPMQAVVYGQESQEKTVKVSIEYRVQGSNATFYKEADPLVFKISSSPVVIHADTLKKISSGQDTDVTVSVISNSPTPLSEVLVKADYPSGFAFTSSDIAPTHDQNEWLIENLQPGTTQTITIKGIVTGKESDENAINFSVGVPSPQDPQTMATVFASSTTQFQIEQPFLNVGLKIDNSTDSEVIVEPGKRSNVTMSFTNTLTDTLYDVSLQVQLSGNAFSIYQLGPSSGYFDPSKNTITWDVSNTPELHQVIPGETKTLNFTIQPSAGTTQTPQVNIDVNATAHRVSESNVSQQLIGTASSDIKVVSVPQIKTLVSHGSGIFTDTGPVPPVSDQTTTYTISMVVTNGSNDVTSAVIDASLPGYVTWLNKVDGNEDVTYDPTSHTVEWKAGDIAANTQAYMSFQVSFLPRSLQIGSIPVLLNQQTIQAVDRFTGSVVHANNVAVTTKLATDTGQNDSTGRVLAPSGN